MISLVRKLLQILPSNDKPKFVGLIFLMFVAGMLEVIGIGLILGFVSVISDPSSLFQAPWIGEVFLQTGIPPSSKILLYGSLVLAGAFFFKNIFLILYYFLQTKFINDRYASISNALFKKYMCMPYHFHLQRNSAALVKNVIVETQLLVTQIVIPVLSICMRAMMIICIGIFLFLMQPTVTVIVFVFIGGFGGLLIVSLKKQTIACGEEVFQTRTFMTQLVNEGLGGIKEILVLNRNKWFIKAFEVGMKKIVKIETIQQAVNLSVKPLIETIAVIGMLLISAILFFEQGSLVSVVPVLTLFGVATFKLLPAVSQMIGQFNLVKYYQSGLVTIHEDLTNVQRQQTNDVFQFTSKTHERMSFSNEIELKEIQFTFPETKEAVIHDLSLRIKKGQAIGIIGPSGAGKTTLVDIILGLLVPDEGVVLVDKKDVHKNSVENWRRNIGYVPQSIYLSDNSIKYNIAFGLDDSEIDEVNLRRAIKMAQLEDFVCSLPHGVDTVVGENGIRMSGGERQRVGIARALYHDPEILIMDEATSSLDTKTEKQITDAVDQLRGECTVIIIAHRLSTVKNCDQLFLIKDGSVADAGTFQDLLERNRDLLSDTSLKMNAIEYNSHTSI